MTTSLDRVVASFRNSPQDAGRSERTRAELREALEAADLLDDLDGYTVRELDDEEILTTPDGGEVMTWQQDYPYAERIDPAEYRA